MYNEEKVSIMSVSHLKLVSALEAPGELLKPIAGVVRLSLRDVKHDHLLISQTIRLRRLG